MSIVPQSRILTRAPMKSPSEVPTCEPPAGSEPRRCGQSGALEQRDRLRQCLSAFRKRSSNAIHHIAASVNAAKTCSPSRSSPPTFIRASAARGAVCALRIGSPAVIAPLRLSSHPPPREPSHDLPRIHRDPHDPRDEVDDVLRVVELPVRVARNARGYVDLHLAAVHDPLDRRLIDHRGRP